MAKYRVELCGSVAVKSVSYVEVDSPEDAVEAAIEHARRWQYLTPVRDRGSPTMPDVVSRAAVYSPYGKQVLHESELGERADAATGFCEPDGR